MVESLVGGVGGGGSEVWCCVMLQDIDDNATKHRSQFLQVFNNSPDESTYYR